MRVGEIRKTKYDKVKEEVCRGGEMEGEEKGSKRRV